MSVVYKYAGAGKIGDKASSLSTELLYCFVSAVEFAYRIEFSVGCGFYIQNFILQLSNRPHG